MLIGCEGSAEGLIESGGLCRQGDGASRYGLELDRCQLAEPAGSGASSSRSPTGYLRDGRATTRAVR